MDDRTRRRLADVERKRAELAAQIDALDAEERMLLETALRAIRENPGPAVKRRLQRLADKGTVGTPMEPAVTPSRGANIAVAKRKSMWPWPSALALAGLSVPEWARAQERPKLSPEAARSWLKAPGKGGRPCPRMWAERIAHEFPDVPAVDASWPNGIRD